MVIVRFSNDAGLYWNDPEIRMGPREQGATGGTQTAGNP